MSIFSKSQLPECHENTVNFAFSQDDVSLLIALTSKLNPDEFPHPLAKSMIYRCRSVVDAKNAGNTVMMKISE